MTALPTDPEVLYADISGGDPGGAATTTGSLATAMSKLDASREAIAQAVSKATEGWEGEAADASAKRANRITGATEASKAKLERAQGAVTAAAAAYRSTLAAANQAITRWRGRPPAMDAAEERALAINVGGELTNIRTDYEQALHASLRPLEDLAPVFEAAAGPVSGLTAAAGATSPAASIPPPGTDPVEVKRWWDSMSEAERDQLLAENFQQLGQLRGLPADVLDTANRRRIDDDRLRYGAERDQLDAQIRERAAELGLDPENEDKLRQEDPSLSDLIDRRNEAARRQHNAQIAYQEINSEPVVKHGDAYVMHYSPDGPGGKQGTLAIAFGNPDTADNLAVVVPGTGTRIDSGFPSGSAIDLHAQMNESDPNGKNATIAWLGYDAPDEILGWDVTQDDQAREGAGPLVDDVNGYRATNPDAHVTVIGHSYGSTLVGHAGLNGLAADDIAFIGSPGVGASDAGQLSAGEGHVWAGATEHDPVVQATGGSHFTSDGSSTGPYDSSFGANRFATGNEGHIGGAHSDYYEGESLDNLGRIATGNYGDVSEQHWLDSPLGPELPGSDIPIIGGAIDTVGNVIKEGADIVTDVGGGVWEAGGQILDGDFSGAGGTIVDTATEVGSDVLDVTVGAVGDVVETGRGVIEAGVDVVEAGAEVVEDAGEAVADGAEWAYENTLGRIF